MGKPGSTTMRKSWLLGKMEHIAALRSDPGGFRFSRRQTLIPIIYISGACKGWFDRLTRNGASNVDTISWTGLGLN